MALDEKDIEIIRTLMQEEIGPLDAKIVAVKDEMLRAFQMSVEEIRKEVAYADEVVDLRQRVSTIEKHVGITAADS